MIRLSQDPEAELKRVVENNPEMKKAYDKAISYINQYDGDYKTAFYNLVEKNGIEPDSYLNSLK